MTHCLEDLHILFQHASDLVQVTSPEGLLIYANPAWCGVLGYDAAQIVGLPMGQLLDSTMRDRYHQLCTALQAQAPLSAATVPSTPPIQLTLLTQAGSRVTVAGRMIYRVAGGRSPQIWSLWRVLSLPAPPLSWDPDPHQMQERYRLATRAARVGVWEWNVQTGEFYLDPNAKALLGYTDEEIANDLNGWITYIHPDDRQPLMAAAQAYLDGETDEYRFEHRMQHKDGSLRWILAQGNAIRNAQGDVVRMVGTDSDITDRKLAEIEVLKALKRERELNEIKSQFVSMVSHEFRTPLTVIQSATDLLEMVTEDSEDHQEYYRQIATAIAHMIRLLDDVLLTGKLACGQLDVHRSEIDVTALCHCLLEEMQLACSPDYTWHFTGSGPPRPLLLDPKLLRQILHNLLSNAVKYSPQGGDVHLRLIYQPSGVSLQVQDFGIGIPAADQAQLFDPFYRAENVGTIQGNGLGLAIVKQCVELQGGAIAVQSTVGQGTMVTVTLGSL